MRVPNGLLAYEIGDCDWISVTEIHSQLPITVPLAVHGDLHVQLLVSPDRLRSPDEGGS